MGRAIYCLASETNLHCKDFKNSSLISACTYCVIRLSATSLWFCPVVQNNSRRLAKHCIYHTGNCISMICSKVWVQWIACVTDWCGIVYNKYVIYQYIQINQWVFIKKNKHYVWFRYLDIRLNHCDYTYTGRNVAFHIWYLSLSTKHSDNVLFQPIKTWDLCTNMV